MNHQDVLGLYVQHQRHWNEKIISIAGLRFDKYSKVGSALSPRLGLIYEAFEADTFKLLWGQAFRSRFDDELFTKNNPVVIGNEDLKPETVDTYELIWLHLWQKGHLNVTLFQNDFKDAIRQGEMGATRTYLNNPATESSNGIELELVGRIGSHFKANIAATKLLSTPDAFFREAEEWVTVTATYTADTWYGNASIFYVGDRENQVDPISPRESIKRYTVVDLKAGWLVSDSLEPYLELRNALDKDYDAPAVAEAIAGGIPNRSRELRVGLTWSY